MPGVQVEMKCLGSRRWTKNTLDMFWAKGMPTWETGMTCFTKQES